MRSCSSWRLIQCTVWFRLGTGIEPSLRRRETLEDAVGGGAGAATGTADECLEEVALVGADVTEDDGDLAMEEEDDDRDGDGPWGSFGDTFICVLRSRNHARTLKRFGKRDEGRWWVVVVVVVVAPVGRDEEFTWDEWMYLRRNGNGASFSNWLVMRSKRSFSPWTRIKAQGS